MEKYIKAKESLDKNISKYEATKNKETATAQKLHERIKKQASEIWKLEKNKNDVILSKTCQTYVDSRIKQNYFWRRKQLDTDPINKGIECEKEAVFVLNKATGHDFKKSKGDKMENERCTGHEDIDDTENKETRDTKVCISMDTFPILKQEVDSGYMRQWQWYMRLKWEDYKKHTVAKVLVNTPLRIIKKKLYRMYADLERQYDGNYDLIDKEYAKKSKEYFLNNVYDKQLSIESNGFSLTLSEEEVIPYEKRVHLYTFDRDDDKIQKIIKRVEQIRLYLSQNGY